jgi:hypothetical protein
MNTNGKRPRRGKPKVVGVTLYPGDVSAVDEIKKKHGLLRDSDAIRLAIRETTRLIETEARQPA